MLKCPICKKDLQPSIPDSSHSDAQDIEFTCENAHLFFVRIRAEDLIDEND
jgi:hypothetical protein